MIIMVMVVLEYFPTVIEISGVELRSSSVPIPQVAIIVEHLELNLRFSIISKVLNGLVLLETFHLIWTKNMNIYHCGS